MSPRAILDTGPLVASLNRQETQHEWALQQFRNTESPLLTCEAVLSEACFLVHHRQSAVRTILEFVARGVIRIPFRVETEATAVSKLLTRYANVPMSLADACLVRMAELNDDSPVLTLDSDFRIYRIHGRRMIPTIMPGR